MLCLSGKGGGFVAENIGFKGRIWSKSGESRRFVRRRVWKRILESVDDDGERREGKV